MTKEIFPPESWARNYNSTNLKRYEYYYMLRELKIDFLKQTAYRDGHNEFRDYVKETAGIGLQFQDNMITEQFDIVDEEKFFIFKLKQ